MSILVKADTQILVQGITGREAATFTRESLDYGAKIVAGVTPGKGGMTLHQLPVYDSVAEAVQQHRCDATVISVPAPFVLDAVLEALFNGIKLLVIVTERIPRRDVVMLLEAAAAHDARVIGPNSLGIISPGQTRVGMAGGAVDAIHRAYMPGCVGVVSRSGGMMTEIASMLTQKGIGQSTCVSIGGDPIVGSTMLDLLPLYEDDPDTKAIVMYAEPGGSAEECLAEYVMAHSIRIPIIAFVAGRFTDGMQGIRFGHAGTIVEGDKGSPAGKIRVLRESGVLVADKLSQVPELVKAAVESREV
ncbi:MAG: succinate--CoA ligase subunit alpha [Anaerolineae bacterium]|nr:succinate--CoA ligase subunit alpha [Anaerolineae bacterium]